MSDFYICFLTSCANSVNSTTELKVTHLVIMWLEINQELLRCYTEVDNETETH